MDYVVETPTKRRKLQNGESQSYNSQDDSSDEIFKDYETIATVPVDRPIYLPSDIPSSPPLTTQPTQIIDRSAIKSISTPRPNESIVQVEASSPVQTTPKKSPAKPNVGGAFVNAFAPPGTAFRPPGAVLTASRLHAVDLDDEGPIYCGSSDEDIQDITKNDIKPSNFTRRSQDKAGINGANQLNGDTTTNTRFHELTSKFSYDPIEKWSTTNQRSNASSADTMANAYGNSSRLRKPIQSSPDTPNFIDAIQDYEIRRKVERMKIIIPKTPISAIYKTLLRKRGNVDDALEVLTSADNNTIVIDESDDDNNNDDELSIGTAKPIQRGSNKSTAKQHIKAPARSIQDKWASMRATQKPPQSQPQRPISSIISSPVSSQSSTPQKPKRRLMRGRKGHSPPILFSSPAQDSPKKLAPTSDYNSDSGIESTVEENPTLDAKILNFFNTCLAEDLIDISGTTVDIANAILAERPFANLNAIRDITMEAPSKATRGKRKMTKQQVGDKILDKSIEMWTGYEAVDTLVAKCSALGKPVADEMKKWGVDVFGAAKEGEVAVVSFDDMAKNGSSEKSYHDSGIGTPTSVNSADEYTQSSKRGGKQSSNFISQPSMMAETLELKDYQVVGLNWLALLFRQKLSCILADEMGLGKTCQVIAFLSHLFEIGETGPHLVIVPGSTLENWLREFKNFCPALNVMPYYGKQNERAEFRAEIENNLDSINVIVTTYSMAKQKEDSRFLRTLRPCVCVFDEGHQLKNSKSANYEQLIRIPARFRLLLTGTPLQNNLQELASLLGFILPSVFLEQKEELEYIFKQKSTVASTSNPSALLSAQRIMRARSMLTPFVLRRKKHQVLKHLPAKHSRVEYCPLTITQRAIIDLKQSTAATVIAARAAGNKANTKETAHIMMSLRQASIHPLLIRYFYSDDKLKKIANRLMKALPDRNEAFIYEDIEIMSDFELHRMCTDMYPKVLSKFKLPKDAIMDSGKAAKLIELLTTYRDNGDRCLLFSQFTLVLDILESVLEKHDLKFFRLDGSTRVEDRQDMIDEFHTDTSIPVFLLTTGAGGAGINLACANKVIIFDSSFNPQDDVQAENRAHRVGQTREVEVVRFVSKDSIEEKIYALGRTKLALDDRVAGDGEGDAAAKKLATKGEKMVQEMWMKEVQRKVEGKRDDVVMKNGDV
ncbi:MAG: hypothetical protein M1834_004615 [Cirrosporium novae-zelandiae]|nr:MAG: hypothetical protein M1834_004615 [Cirrosporium novae-zelandiae]